MTIIYIRYEKNNFNYFNCFSFVSSCISKKDYAALEATNKQNKDLLNTATIKLNACIEDKTNSEASLKTLKDQVAFLES